MHLELKETMNRVSTDIRSKFMSSFKNVADTVCALNPLLKNVNHKAIAAEVNDVLEQQRNSDHTAEPSQSSCKATTSDEKLPLGQLNQSRRLDYVLQEAPLEFFNEYLFALTAHVSRLSRFVLSIY